MKKSPLLRAWMRDRRYFTTHEVNTWGSENCMCSANRRKQEWLRTPQNPLGPVVPLTDEEKEKIGYRGKDEIYRWEESKPVAGLFELGRAA